VLFMCLSKWCWWVFMHHIILHNDEWRNICFSNTSLNYIIMTIGSGTGMHVSLGLKYVAYKSPTNDQTILMFNQSLWKIKEWIKTSFIHTRLHISKWISSSFSIILVSIFFILFNYTGFQFYIVEVNLNSV